MSSLVVGGVVIPVAPGGIKRDKLDGVDRARAFDLTYRASATGSPKRDWIFSTPPVLPQMAEFYESILAAVAPQVASGDIIGGGGNLLLWSEEFDNAAWTKIACTVGVNVFYAPNGTLTADKLQEDNTNSSHGVQQAITAALDTYTFSVWVVPADRTKCVVNMNDNAGGSAGIGIDLTNGSTFASGLAVGSWTGISTKVTPYPNGWYRVSVTGTRGAGTQTVCQVFIWNTSFSYVGTTGMGMDPWGAQLLAGSVAGSYRKTTSAAVATDASVSCCSEITDWTPVKTSDGHRVVLSFALHEV